MQTLSNSAVWAEVGRGEVWGPKGSNNGCQGYAATKDGVVAVVRAIAAEIAPRKIRVNVVASGTTKTPIWKRGSRANATQEQSAKLTDFFSSAIPLDRWDEAEELARALLFLASEDSSYINEVELVVGGGLTGPPFGALFFTVDSTSSTHIGIEEK